VLPHGYALGTPALSAEVLEFVMIDENTIDLIKRQKSGDSTKVINLVKSIEKAAEENSEDPFLVALSERAAIIPGRPASAPSGIRLRRCYPRYNRMTCPYISSSAPTR
jgi:hypothetical protein